jgi:hypothetical protein
MQNGFVPPATAGGYQGGYQKSFTPNQDGFKPRSTFVKPDFNGNPRAGNPQFAGDKPPFQNKYMGNKPRTPFNGAPARFNGDFGGQQKFNKYDNYKGGYGQGEGAPEGEDFQGGNQYNNQPGRHYNNSTGNRFDQQQPADQPAPAAHGQQPFVQTEAVDGAQFDTNMIQPHGYRMAIPKQIYDANAGQMQFQQAYGEFNYKFKR